MVTEKQMLRYIESQKIKSEQRKKIDMDTKINSDLRAKYIEDKNISRMKRKTSSISYRNKLAIEKGFNDHKEYLDNLAKEKGFNSYKEYQEHRLRKKGFINRSDYQNHLSQQRGFGSQQDEFIFKKGFNCQKEYRNYLFKRMTGSTYIDTITRLNDWARSRDFNDYKEYLDIITAGRGIPGIPNIICDDRRDSHFIGHIAEYGVSKIFKNIQGMFFTNRGYDFICEMGEKIDVKSSILHPNNKFTFHIEYNDIADYFILIGFDNVLDLNPMHLWIIKNKEIIQEIPINNRKVLSIANNKKCITIFKKYEKEEKLEELKNVCVEYNKESGISDNTLTKVHILGKSLGIKLWDVSIDLTKIMNILKERQKKRRIDSKIPILLAEECNE